MTNAVSERFSNFAWVFVATQPFSSNERDTDKQTEGDSVCFLHFKIKKTGLKRVKWCKIWGYHSGDYEGCRLLGYKNPFFTSQEAHYFSVTKTSRLMLYKIWGFCGGDYEECLLLGYKTPVLTSQEAHYVSATDPRLLLLCQIWGFHGSDCEECRLLVCDVVWLM
jgi:hypothetical protein